MDIITIIYKLVVYHDQIIVVLLICQMTLMVSSLSTLYSSVLLHINKSIQINWHCTFNNSQKLKKLRGSRFSHHEVSFLTHVNNINKKFLYFDEMKNVT